MHQTTRQALRSDEWNPTREAVKLHTALRRVIDDDDHQAVRYLRDILHLDPREDDDRELILGQLGIGWGGEHGRWHHRVTWPYFNADGTIAGSCGRTLIDEADHPDDGYPFQKWMTTRSKWGFSKRHHLWGVTPAAAAHIADEGTVLLVEGAKDATVIRALVPQAMPAVATVSASLTVEQGELLDTLGATDVFVLADNDRGGQGMAAGIAGLAHRWPHITFWDHGPALPPGLDPGACNAEQIVEALAWDGAERLLQPPPKPRRPASPGAAAVRLRILRHPANDLRLRMRAHGFDAERDRIDCTFHDPEGSRNSLGIFEDTIDGGFWRWRCHSGRCGLGGTVIDFEAHRLGITNGDAFARAARRAERLTT